MVSKVGAYALIMLVMILLFDLTFIMVIFSETGVKVTFEFGLTIIPVPAIDLFLTERYN